MRIYIAGPMRGIDRLNYPAFDAARDYLTWLGHTPISPADLDRATGVTVDSAAMDDFIAGALRRDFAALVTCDAIAFLPGWKNSMGANAERRVAEDIGLPLYDVQAWSVFALQTEGYEVVGLSGYAQSGKDTIAARLLEDGWERVAFADKLREALYTLNPEVRYTYGSSVIDFNYASLQLIVDTHGWDWAKTRSSEVRQLLQRMGTDVGRQLLGDNVWVDLAMRKLEPGHKYVFTDVRFPNEAEAIRRVGGKMWRVERPGTGPVNGHISETALDDWKFDRIIKNDGTIDELNKLVAA